MATSTETEPFVSFPSLGKMGGLGNQLFQIAATIGLAHTIKARAIFPGWGYSDFFMGPITTGEVPDPDFLYIEPNFHYEPIPPVPNTWLKGYFQSERYFEHIKDVIERIFSPTDKALARVGCNNTSGRNNYVEWLNFVDTYNTCAIHIKRGQYLKYQDYYPVQSIDYYVRCMNDLEKSETDLLYLIFSDDVGWCKDVFIGPGFYFPEGDVIGDFALMSRCKHFIIANSTLSWWAAWLGSRRSGGSVYAPKKWFGPAYSHHDTKDLYPEGWIVVEA